MREKNNTNLERMRELIERLTEADIAYYKNDAPIMTDLEYDRLTEELTSLEHDTGLVLSGSPTQKVSGEILESLAEVQHTKPMLSAGKTKSIEDLIRFAAGRAVLLSWKMDGLTLVLRYEYGKLKQAITRGREGCALPGFVDSKNEEKTERNAGYLVVSQSGGGMLRQGTRKGIRRTPANRGMRAHRIVKSLDISEDVCHGLCP